MASYKLSAKPSVEKDLRRIDRSMVPKILESIQSLATDPFPLQSRKLVASDKTYRIRVGDYRVVYQVIEDLQTIEVQKVRHRKEVYR